MNDNLRTCLHTAGWLCLLISLAMAVGNREPEAAAWFLAAALGLFLVTHRRGNHAGAD